MLFVNAIMTKLDQKVQVLSILPHVLVVDDDQRICELLSKFLTENDFVVMHANDASQARKMLEHFEFDVLVVDVMMPGETGLELITSIRKYMDIPVLLLTALGEAEDRIAGLEVGADDYLAKPFEPRELVLRLNAILRRTSKVQIIPASFKVGRWHFDSEQEEFVDGENVIRLTSVEANLIRALASRSGEVMSREELAESCGVDAGERTIDVQVTRLRRKIEENTRAPRYLQTVRGKGYLLRIEEI